MCNKRVYWYLIHLMLLICVSTEETISNQEQHNNGSEVILSRRKRYLIFPEGSSLQLVYCFTIPILGRPAIWTFGITASLAWLLPSEPEHIRNIKNLKKTVERIDKVSTGNKLIYTDQKHPPTYKDHVPNTDYRQTYIPRYPAGFTGPTNYDNGSMYSVEPFYRYSDRKKYSYKENSYHKPNNWDTVYDNHNYYKHPLYTKLHRITRRGLYPKIEEFFRTQHKDGRACLLKAICEVSKTADGEGSFIEEIIKTIFRNRPNTEEHEEFDDYDMAAQENEDCSKLYPTCTYN